MMASHGLWVMRLVLSKTKEKKDLKKKKEKERNHSFWFKDGANLEQTQMQESLLQLSRLEITIPVGWALSCNRKCSSFGQISVNFIALSCIPSFCKVYLVM